MTIVAVPNFWYPPLLSGDGAPGNSFIRLDGDGEKAACIFKVPATGNIDAVVWRTSQATQWFTNGVRVSLQTMDTGTGYPDGTVDESKSETSDLGIAWHESVLDSSRAVTAGDDLCFVIDWVGAFDAGDDIDVKANTMGDGDRSQNCYGAFHNGTSWAAAIEPVLSLRYDDGSYHQISDSMQPAAANGDSFTFNSGDTTFEHGVIFQVPVPMRINALWGYWDNDNDTTLVLYEGTTEKRTVAIPAIMREGTSYRTQIGPIAEYTLNRTTDYRISIRPGASDIRMTYFNRSTTAKEAALGGSTWRRSSRAAGGWTEVDGQTGPFGFRVNGLDDGVAPALVLGVM